MRIVEGEQLEEDLVRFTIVCDECGARFLWDSRTIIVECPECEEAEALMEIEIDLPDESDVQGGCRFIPEGYRLQEGFSMMAGYDLHRFLEDLSDCKDYSRGESGHRRIRAIDPSI
jgi:DNA-directed RNA polymerase subunit RPC12/RpoP